MARIDNTERDKAIYEAKKAGVPLAEIAATHKLSVGRTYQMACRYDRMLVGQSLAAAAAKHIPAKPRPILPVLKVTLRPDASVDVMAVIAGYLSSMPEVLAVAMPKDFLNRVKAQPSNVSKDSICPCPNLHLGRQVYLQAQHFLNISYSFAAR